MVHSKDIPFLLFQRSKPIIVGIMKKYVKRDYPVGDVRRFIEPGPIVLVSSSYKEQRTIMTMGWHMIMEMEPSLIGCYIWSENFSSLLIRKSRECVINLPTLEIAKETVGCGNCSGRDVDKFEKFGLTPLSGTAVKAPLIKECYANFECRLVDTSLIKKFSLFVFEVVKAHVAVSPKFPKTIHYRGDGLFMVAGPTVKTYRKLFRPEML